MKALAKVLATFFGLGLAPVLPGTVASAATTLLFVFLVRGLSGPLYVGLVVVLFFAGVAVSKVAADALGRPDPGRVVIDEVCGQIVWGGDWRTFRDGPHVELDRRVYS